MLDVLANRDPAQRNEGLFIEPSTAVVGFYAIPSGVSVVADDKRALLTLEGPQKDLTVLTNLIKFFDQEPKPIEIDVTLDCPLDHFHAKNTLQSVSGDEWVVKSSNLDIQVTGKCRASDDGTVFIFLNVRSSAGTVRYTIREAIGKPVSLRIEGSRVVSNHQEEWKHLVIRRGFGPTAPDIRGSFASPFTVEVCPRVLGISR